MKDTTLSGLEQILKVFKKPVKEKDICEHISLVKDADRLIGEHRKKYSESIYLPDWEEIVLVFEGLNPSINLKNLEFVATTSYHAQARRRDHIKDITPIGVAGLIITSDNKIVYGIRGGDEGKGYVSISPIGYLSNSLFITFNKELREELGIERYIDKPVLIGYFSDPEDAKSTDFVFLTHTELSSNKINNIHKAAFDVYQEAVLRGIPELEARKEIKKAGFLNVDAWEHTQLIFIDNKLDVIDKIINSRIISHNNKNYTLKDHGRAPLIMYKAYQNR